MDKYLIQIKTSTIVEVEAFSKEEALKLLKDNLIKTNQIKPDSPVEFQIVEEAIVNK